MDNNMKDRMIKALDQNKAGIRVVREALMSVPGSERARRNLHQAEFSVLSGMHDISWIGLREEVNIEEDNSSITDDDNPSA